MYSSAFAVPSLSHLTSCTPTKSNLYLANSLAAAAASVPALYRAPNVPSTKSQVPFLLLSISQGPRLFL